MYWAQCPDRRGRPSSCRLSLCRSDTGRGWLQFWIPAGSSLLNLSGGPVNAPRVRIWAMRNGIIVNVTSAERARLRALVANRNSPQKHVWLAKIILLTEEGLGT